MKQLILGFLALSLVLAGCSDSEQGVVPIRIPPSQQVLDFVEQEEFPFYRNTERAYGLREIEYFKSVYGEGEDCPSGCIYNRAIGLKYGERVGWLHVEDLRGREPQAGRFFNFEETDTELFNMNMWFHLLQMDCLECFDALLIALASDPDTIRPALVSLCGILYSSVKREAANNLVENSAVSGDPEILGLLANLPEYGGDIYEGVRTRAQELLDNLNR